MSNNTTTPTDPSAPIAVTADLDTVALEDRTFDVTRPRGGVDVTDRVTIVYALHATGRDEVMAAGYIRRNGRRRDAALILPYGTSTLIEVTDA